MNEPAQADPRSASSSRRHTAIAAVVSLGVHAAFALWAWRAERTPAPAPPQAPTSVTLRFTTPPEAPAPVPEVAPAPEARAPQPMAPRTRRRRRRPPPVAPPNVPPAPPSPATAGGSAPALDASGRHVGDPRRAPAEAPGGLDLAVRPPGPPGPQLVLPEPAPPGAPVRLIPRKGGGYMVKDGGFTAYIANDGSISFEDKTALERWHGLSYEIDITHEIMRAAGDDPFRHAKEQVRLKTKALREEMAAEACQRRLQDSVLALRDRLDRIWQDEAQARSSRRATLFQLWDECAEDGDPQQLESAEMARATILAFIAEQLPEGSADAFSPEELAMLNARRRSQGRFSPYADATK